MKRGGIGWWRGRGGGGRYAERKGESPRAQTEIDQLPCRESGCVGKEEEEEKEKGREKEISRQPPRMLTMPCFLEDSSSGKGRKGEEEGGRKR